MAGEATGLGGIVISSAGGQALDFSYYSTGGDLQCDADGDGICDDVDDCIGSEDCAGTCNGSAVLDDCEVCDGGNSSQDCAGVCDGDAIEDCAGVCNGSALVDCSGACGGSAVVDECGICGGDGIADGECD